jgi:hypothetical protein
MQAVRAEKRVERAVPVTKNAAQASDTGVGQGTHRPLLSEKAAMGRRLLLHATISRARIFPACGTRFSERMGCIDASSTRIIRVRTLCRDTAK